MPWGCELLWNIILLQLIKVKTWHWIETAHIDIKTKEENILAVLLYLHKSAYWFLNWFQIMIFISDPISATTFLFLCRWNYELKYRWIIATSRIGRCLRKLISWTPFKWITWRRKIYQFLWIKCSLHRLLFDLNHVKLCINGNHWLLGV